MNMPAFPWSFKSVGKASLKSSPSILGISLLVSRLEEHLYPGWTIWPGVSGLDSISGPSSLGDHIAI